MVSYDIVDMLSFDVPSSTFVWRSVPSMAFIVNIRFAATSSYTDCANEDSHTRET